MSSGGALESESRFDSDTSIRDGMYESESELVLESESEFEGKR